MDAKLVVVGGDAKATEVKLKLPSVIGRGREASLTLPHALVSRKHCEITDKDGILFVRDLGSLNGTFVGNERVDEAALPPGELLTIGTVTFRAVYELPEGVELPGGTSHGGQSAETVYDPNGNPVEAGESDDDLTPDFDAMEDFDDMDDIAEIDEDDIEDSFEEVEEVEESDESENDDEVMTVDEDDFDISTDDEVSEDDPHDSGTNEVEADADDLDDMAAAFLEEGDEEEEAQKAVEDRTINESKMKFTPPSDEDDDKSESSDNDEDLGNFLQGMK